MLAAYVEKPNKDNPLSALVVGQRPDPQPRDGWEIVRVEACSLNRHDIWSLQGVTQHPPLPLPMILGCDASGRRADGTPVILYPGAKGDGGSREDETLDPCFNVFSELAQGTMADYVIAPVRSILPRPERIPALDGAALGTTWLTAYRAIFSKARLRPGQCMLVQGSSGGLSTALVQLGVAAGLEVWVASRSSDGHSLAERLGAHRTWARGTALPHKVDAVFDSVGESTWNHSLESVKRGGTVVVLGRTTGANATTNIPSVFRPQIKIVGTQLGTLNEMRDMVNFVAMAGLRPVIGKTMPLEHAEAGFRAMLEGSVQGKIVFTRPD